MEYDFFDAFSTYDIVDVFNDDEFYDCIEIVPDDLDKLSNACKILKNNSFLMHGYARFHHLLLGKVYGDERMIFLGVPGVLTRSENGIANMYGFHKFKSSHRSDTHMCCFGYWYILLQSVTIYE